MVKLIWMSLVVCTLITSSSQRLQCPQKKGDALYYSCSFNGRPCQKILRFYSGSINAYQTCNATTQRYSFDFHFEYHNPDDVQPNSLSMTLYCEDDDGNSTAAIVTTMVEWNPDDPDLSRGERHCHSNSQLTCDEINRIWPGLIEGIEHIVEDDDGATGLLRSTTTPRPPAGGVTETMARNQTRDSRSSGGGYPALVVACVLGWLSALGMTLLAGYQRRQLQRRGTWLTTSIDKNGVRTTTAKEPTKPTATERTETSTLTDADMKSLTQQDASDASMMSEHFSINKTHVRTPTAGKSDSLKTTEKPE